MIIVAAGMLKLQRSVARFELRRISDGEVTGYFTEIAIVAERDGRWNQQLKENNGRDENKRGEIGAGDPVGSDDD